MKFLRISSLFLAIGLFVACGIVDAADNSWYSWFTGSKTEEKKPASATSTPSLGYSWYKPLAFYGLPALVFAHTYGDQIYGGKTTALGGSLLAFGLLAKVRKDKAFADLDKVEMVVDDLWKKEPGSGFSGQDEAAIIQAVDILDQNKNFLNSWLVSKERMTYTPKEPSEDISALGSFIERSKEKLAIALNSTHDENEVDFETIKKHMDPSIKTIPFGWFNEEQMKDLFPNIRVTRNSGIYGTISTDSDDANQINMKVAYGLIRLSYFVKLECNDIIPEKSNEQQLKKWYQCMVKKAANIIKSSA